jgi:uncharacterized protein (TIGR02284 family)
MSTLNDQHIRILNSLVEATLDSAHGYRDAAKEATNPRFKSLFERRAMERKQLTADLQAEVRGLGGTPEDDGTILAAAHRMFLNLKNTVTGSDQGIVNEIESGEDHIKAKFEEAMRQHTLSVPVKDAVIKAYAVIKADHDQMRDLKHELKAHPTT